MSDETPATPPDDDDGAAPEPNSPTRRRYRYVRLQPHRANTVLGMGVSGVALAVFGSMMALGAYFCCPLWLIPLGSLGLSIPAWQMGQIDLAAMRDGRMDPTGKDSTMIGMICGIIGVSIIALGATAIILIVVVYIVIIVIASVSQ